MDRCKVTGSGADESQTVHLRLEEISGACMSRMTADSVFRSNNCGLRPQHTRFGGLLETKIRDIEYFSDRTVGIKENVGTLLLLSNYEATSSGSSRTKSRGDEGRRAATR